MDFVYLTLSLVLLPLGFISLCFVWPPYLLFKLLSFTFRSIFPENVKGKVVLITGASSGIGEHVAYEYAKRGARLALAARRERRLREVAEKAKRLGSPDALVISADVSKEDSCRDMIEATISHFGRVDHLVNNAGIVVAKLFDDGSDQLLSEMNGVMDTNFWGYVYSTKFALPHLKKSKGKIIIISSAGSWTPFPTLSFYCASKAALECLFEALRIEVGSEEVKITIVTPGFIETPMSTRNLDNSSPHSNEPVVKFLEKSKIPAVKVEQCAKTIVKSACRGDKYVTTPIWCLPVYYFRMFCPDIVEAVTRLFLQLGYMSG